MKELQQDTRMTLLSRLPVMMLSFLAMTILTRWLGPEGNGVYTFIFANINLLLLLLGLQSDAAVIHFLSKPDADRNKVGSISILTTGMGFGICALIVLCGGLFVPFFKNILIPVSHPFSYFLWFIVLSFLFRKTQNMSLAILRSTLRFNAYTKLQLWAQLIPVLMYLYGFVALSRASAATDIVPVFNFILIAQAIIAVAGLCMVFFKWKFNFTFDVKSDFSTFISFSSKSTLDAIARFINRRIDVYFVQAYKGVHALGQYGLAAQINSFTQEAIMPFTQVMNPYLVRSDESTKREVVGRMSRIVLAATMLLACMILITAPFFIPLLFGKAFSGAVIATQILSMAIVISSMRLVFAGYFQSTNQLRINIQANWLGVLITLILDILLIPTWGIEGAAVASVAAYATSMLFLLIHFALKTKLPLKDLLFLRKKDIQWLLHKNQPSE